MTNLQYKTYTFQPNPRRISVSYVQNIAAHLLPAYGTLSQPLGPRCRVVRCEGEVFDTANADSAAAKLRAIAALCDDSASGMLYLPTGQQFEAAVSRFSYTAQGDGRILSYAIEFTESERKEVQEE